MKVFKRQSGQTLLEAVVALAILGIILGASAIAIITSVNNATFARSENLANKYAQQGMEFIRNLKVNDYTTFSGLDTGSDWNAPTTYCLKNLSFPLPIPGACRLNVASDFINDGSGNFIREVEFRNAKLGTANVPITPYPPECTVNFDSPTELVRGERVTVKVRWSSGKCDTTNPYCHSSEIVSCFFDPNLNN